MVNPGHDTVSMCFRPKWSIFVLFLQFVFSSLFGFSCFHGCICCDILRILETSVLRRDAARVGRRRLGPMLCSKVFKSVQKCVVAASGLHRMS
jgi:hypothetical protein